LATASRAGWGASALERQRLWDGRPRTKPKKRTMKEKKKAEKRRGTTRLTHQRVQLARMETPLNGTHRTGEHMAVALWVNVR
jgi:hypothetical protein